MENYPKCWQRRTATFFDACQKEYYGCQFRIRELGLTVPGTSSAIVALGDGDKWITVDMLDEAGNCLGWFAIYPRSKTEIIKEFQDNEICNRVYDHASEGMEEFFRIAYAVETDGLLEHVDSRSKAIRRAKKYAKQDDEIYSVTEQVWSDDVLLAERVVFTTDDGYWKDEPWTSYE